MLTQKRNIGFLALLQIMVLLFPLLVKDLHHHENANHINSMAHMSCFTTHEDICNICSFDYLPFLASNIKNVDFSKVVVFKFVIPFCSKITPSYFNLSLLRAPPVC